MKNNLEFQAKKSIIDIHELIEDIFINKEPLIDGALEKINSYFLDDFEMVTTEGQRIGLTQVNEMFINNMGKREGLKIDIDSIEVITVIEDNAVVCYREVHSQNDVISQRWATAIMELTDGQLCWRYLHETSVKG
ncbi:DUF4440 domain-containing protein [Dongshaea marina]|uniref:DUF4440 domain-containing protein n=1 Tax=Dongshaea marina TaxID=2047966 RepID=UPI000D3EA85D|nr:DUF4440 domain-containing protein [Dongshaea marina]